MDLRNAPTDRDDAEVFSVKLNVPGALVALLKVLERRLPAPDGLAPGDPEKVRRVHEQIPHRL